MSVDFTLTSKTRNDVFTDRSSINDVTQYNFDCTAWAEDNDDITSALWSIESGSASLSNESITANVITGMINFTQAGKVAVSILLSTASGITKKIWLQVQTKDRQIYTDDYGRCS